MTLFKGYNFRVYTPDGTMFVDIMEDTDGQPIEVHAFIGKAGSAVAAWAAATCGMVSLGLRRGIPLQDIINELADITSDGTARIGNATDVRSGPEGVYSALINYRNAKREEANAAEAEGVDVRDSSSTRTLATNSEAR